MSCNFPLVLHLRNLLKLILMVVDSICNFWKSKKAKKINHQVSHNKIGRNSIQIPACQHAFLNLRFEWECGEIWLEKLKHQIPLQYFAPSTHWNNTKCGLYDEGLWVGGRKLTVTLLLKVKQRVDLWEEKKEEEQVSRPNEIGENN